MFRSKSLFAEGEQEVNSSDAAKEPQTISEELGPFFSVVIATYNQGKFLEEAIGSVLRQGWRRQVNHCCK